MSEDKVNPKDNHDKRVTTYQLDVKDTGNPSNLVFCRTADTDYQANEKTGRDADQSHDQGHVKG